MELFKFTTPDVMTFLVLAITSMVIFYVAYKKKYSLIQTVLASWATAGTLTFAFGIIVGIAKYFSTPIV